VATLIVLLGIVAIQSSAPAPVQAPEPAGWPAAAKTLSSLLMDQKCPEAIALAEQWVAKHPSFAEAHLRLGSGYENVARGFCGGPRETRANRMKQFETAATHFRRAFELGGGETPWITIRVLVDLYDLGALDRPDEQEKIAREAVVRYPAEPLSHVELITSLLKRGAEPEAAKAAAAARAALPKTATPRFDMAHKLAFRAKGSDPILKVMLTRETRTAMARIALAMFDDVLAISPEHKDARREKTELERAMAELANEPSRRR
jgi:tetratricopeptide (TPR) repeat protein